jgi:L-ribulose-5-phosphate 3-epimerase
VSWPAPPPRALRAGELDHLDFARTARERFGIDAVEYVNTFFKDKARDAAYLREMRKRADDLGVRSLLIMCDGEGDIGDPDADARARTVENHRRWIEAAAALGCHSIRVNAASRGTREQQRDLAADGLRRLAELGDAHAVNVIVENHGGLSSDGSWLAEVMRQVAHPRCGTLPDFGNFCSDWSRADDPAAWYDRYKGVAEMMPFAKAVSAKSHEFDERGDEARTDYRRMMRIVVDAGYRGYVGVEYEGDKHPEPEGIRLTKALLERVREEMSR